MEHDGVEADDEEERQKVGRDEEDGLKEEREGEREGDERGVSGNERACVQPRLIRCMKTAAMRIRSSSCLLGE